MKVINLKYIYRISYIFGKDIDIYFNKFIY